MLRSTVISMNISTQRRQPGGIGPKEPPALAGVHGHPRRPLGHVGRRRRRDLRQHPDEDGHGNDRDQSRDARHPGVGHVPIQQIGAQRFCGAVGEDETRAQSRGQQFGHAAAFQERQDHAEYHPQGKAVHERERQSRTAAASAQTQQGRLRNRNQQDDSGNPPLGMKFRNDFDAEKLRERIARSPGR